MAQGFVNDRTTDYLSLKSRLIDSASNRQRADHFDALNRHLRPGLVTPGQLVIVPDTYSVSCSLEEAWLMRYAQEVRRDLDASAGSAVINNYDLLQYLGGWQVVRWGRPPLGNLVRNWLFAHVSWCWAFP